MAMCPKCGGGSNYDGTGSTDSSNDIMSNGYLASDGVAIENGTGRVAMGKPSAVGKAYTIENGMLKFIGNTWQSTTFLLGARQVMQAFVAEGSLYSQKITRDLSAFGLPSIVRKDCSGYVSAVLWKMGYVEFNGSQSYIKNSQTDLDQLYGFSKNTTYKNMQPGDIVRLQGHTEIFVCWEDDSKVAYFMYSCDGTASKFLTEGGSYCEPMRRENGMSRFICSYTPTERDTHRIDYTGSASSGNSSNSVNSSKKDVKSGTVITDTTNTSDYFQIYSIEEGDSVYNRIIEKSYPKNCGIALSDLKYIKVLHYNYSGNVQVGEIIVNSSVANDTLSIFKELYNKKYQIQSMYLIDNYWTGEGNDTDSVSIAANNTSAFCYRTNTGGSSLSNHAKGKAIDINPKQNPYVSYSSGSPVTYHEGAGDYVDRTTGKAHMILANDEIVTLFKSKGYVWGGDWTNPKDYQHFERN